MRVRSVWLAGILVAGALLGGCADEDAPSTLPEVTTSPSSTANGSATEPGLVDDSATEVEQDIQAFYAEYARLTDESFQSIEALEQSRTYFADTCVSCKAGYDIAAEVLAQGHTVEGAPTRVLAVEVDSLEGNSVVFRSVLDVPAAIVRNSQGEVVADYPPTPNVTTLYTAQQQQSGRWLIVADQVLG